MSQHRDTPEGTQEEKNTGAFLEEKNTLSQNTGKMKHKKSLSFPEARIQHPTENCKQFYSNYLQT